MINEKPTCKWPALLGKPKRSPLGRTRWSDVAREALYPVENDRCAELLWVDDDAAEVFKPATPPLLKPRKRHNVFELRWTAARTPIDFFELKHAIVRIECAVRDPTAVMGLCRLCDGGVFLVGGRGLSYEGAVCVEWTVRSVAKTYVKNATIGQRNRRRTWLHGLTTRGPHFLVIDSQNRDSPHSKRAISLLSFAHLRVLGAWLYMDCCWGSLWV